MKNSNAKPKIVFMGSGPVAAESLRQISEFSEIEAVVTKSTTEKELLSVSTQSPVYTTDTRTELDELFTTQEFESRVCILIDFGIIVSQKVIDYFEHGIVNSHFSLLPELRGADPISFAILEGKDTTGVSLMLLVEAMDEGPLLAVGEHALSGNETGTSLTEALIELSTDMLANTIPAYIGTNADKPHPISQEQYCDLAGKQYAPTYTRKLTKADGLLDTSKPAIQLEREIRAYNEWPKSRITIGAIECVILAASVTEDTGEPGSITAEKKRLLIHTAQGSLSINQLKPAGKKAMDVAGFLNGYRNRI